MLPPPDLRTRPEPPPAAWWVVSATIATFLLLLALIQIDTITPIIQPSANAPHGTIGSQGTPSTSNPSAARELADTFPDGLIWIRLEGHDVRPDAVSFTWTSGRERCFAPSPETRREADGWWKVEPSRTAIADSTHLAVHAAGFSTTWLVQPTPARQHVIEMQRLRQQIDVRDVDSRRPIEGAGVHLSQCPLTNEEWAPRSLPGYDERTAVYHAIESSPGRYLVNGNPPRTALRYAIHHPHYVRVKGSPAATVLDSPIHVLEAQMPLVASVRYLGDDILDGTISYPGTLPTDPSTVAAMRRWRAQLAQEHADAITILFLPNIDDGPHSPNAVASCILQHGERRTDSIPVIPLSDFSGPTEIHVAPQGDPISMQPVAIKAPPKFGGVEANFKVIVHGGRDFPVKIVTLGETISLPPGDYVVSGRGDWAFGALDRKKFRVTAGKPATFELQWRPGVRMYVIRLEDCRGLGKVQLEGSNNGRIFAVDAPVTEAGIAVLWIRSKIDSGIVRAMGFKPATVAFSWTGDETIARGTCRLESSEVK